MRKRPTGSTASAGPDVAGVYRRKVERLAEALQHPQERDEAADAIRALIDRITLTPGPRRGEIAATLHGDLATILEWVAQKQNTPGFGGSGVSVSVVAGTRNARYLRLVERQIPWVPSKIWL